MINGCHSAYPIRPYRCVSTPNKIVPMTILERKVSVWGNVICAGRTTICMGSVVIYVVSTDFSAHTLLSPTFSTLIILIVLYRYLVLIIPPLQSGLLVSIS